MSSFMNIMCDIVGGVRDFALRKVQVSEMLKGVPMQISFSCIMCWVHFRCNTSKLLIMHSVTQKLTTLFFLRTREMEIKNYFGVANSRQHLWCDWSTFKNFYFNSIKIILGLRFCKLRFLGQWVQLCVGKVW